MNDGFQRSDAKELLSFSILNDHMGDVLSLPTDSSDLLTDNAVQRIPSCNILPTTVYDDEKLESVDSPFVLSRDLYESNPTRIASFDSDCQLSDLLSSCPAVDDRPSYSDAQLDSDLACIFEPPRIQPLRRRFSECGELCRSRFSEMKQSFKRSFSGGKLQRVHLLPIRHDTHFGDVFPCETNKDSCFVFSKKHADYLLSGFA